MNLAKENQQNQLGKFFQKTNQQNEKKGGVPQSSVPVQDTNIYTQKTE
jgi:hypothetical protein